MDYKSIIAVAVIVFMCWAIIYEGLTTPRCPECRSFNLRREVGKMICRRCGAEFSDKS